MRFLENMISGMVKESTGINPRRLVRMVGGKNILLAGGVALAGVLAAKKGGSGGGQDPTARWTGGGTRPQGTPPPPPPPGAEPPAPPPAPTNLPPLPGSRPDGMEGDPPPVEVPVKELSEEAARDVEIPRDLLFAIVRTLVAAALADGHLADVEKSVIDEHLDNSGLLEEQKERIREDLISSASPEELAHMAQGRAQREALYRFAALIVHTDGDVTPEELSWLKRFAEELELTESDATALREEISA